MHDERLPTPSILSMHDENLKKALASLAGGKRWLTSLPKGDLLTTETTEITETNDNDNVIFH